MFTREIERPVVRRPVPGPRGHWWRGCLPQYQRDPLRCYVLMGGYELLADLTGTPETTISVQPQGGMMVSLWPR